MLWDGLLRLLFNSFLWLDDSAVTQELILVLSFEVLFSQFIGSDILHSLISLGCSVSYQHLPNGEIKNLNLLNKK